MTVYSQDEIRELLIRASNYDREAMGTILKSYATQLFFIARLYQRDKRLAKTIEENTFRKIFQQAAQGAVESDCEAWMTDMLKKEMLRSVMPLMELGHTFDSYTEADEVAAKNVRLPDTTAQKQDWILQLLDVLNKEERVVFALHFYDHKSIVDTASEALLTVGSVKSYLSSGKQRLMEANYDLGLLLALIEDVNPNVEITATFARPEDKAPVVTGGLNIDSVSRPKTEQDVVNTISEGDTLQIEKRKRQTTQKIDLEQLQAHDITENDEEDGDDDYDWDDDDYEGPDKKTVGIIILLVCLILMAIGCFAYYFFFM
ncbi:MAG: sigma-70 family RNA polymerase sigma factor [Solobacterium sp.]|nr:sigma-70 family RNA polymerase sigma factor [Solobacterium sp.]